MAFSMEEIRHEGTLPGKTLSRYLAVTSSYLLHSSSFALWDPDIKLKGPVTFMNGRAGTVSLALQIADAAAVRVNVEDHTKVVRHFRVSVFVRLEFR